MPTVPSSSNWPTATQVVSQSKRYATTEGAAKNNTEFSIHTYTYYIHIHTLSAWVDEAYLRLCRLATAEFVVTDTVTICSKAWQEWHGMMREGVPKLTMGIAAM